jgi:hypothetical protein
MYRVLYVGIAALFLLLPVNAAAEDWTIVQSLGAVSVDGAGFSPVAVRPNAHVPENATLTTGSDGRVILIRGQETIMVAPDSRITLPSGKSGDGWTRIQQDFGSAVFQVGKKSSAHFEVRTPYLAAVVKGTVFSVSIDALGASVAVSEGAVEVATADGSDVLLTPAGMTARVDISERRQVRPVAGAPRLPERLQPGHQPTLQDLEAVLKTPQANVAESAAANVPAADEGTATPEQNEVTTEAAVEDAPATDIVTAVTPDMAGMDMSIAAATEGLASEMPVVRPLETSNLEPTGDAGDAGGNDKSKDKSDSVSAVPAASSETVAAVEAGADAPAGETVAPEVASEPTVPGGHDAVAVEPGEISAAAGDNAAPVGSGEPEIPDVAAIVDPGAGSAAPGNSGGGSSNGGSGGGGGGNSGDNSNSGKGKSK